MSASKIDKKYKPRSPEHCSKIAESKKGKSPSRKTRAKISESLKGEKNPNYGKPRSPEHSAKISASIRRETIYKNLTDEINARNLTYSALTSLLVLSSSSNVSAKMRGKRNFTERDKSKLVEIFGKPIEYLLQREE
ncbi:MAG: hypothetical protein IJK81_00845 [Selenomonadaceae bacterium]|nr:hypothetical protein [Selenomonadaceae bacterium]